MKSFDALRRIAARRKGGDVALAALIEKPKTAAALKRIADDRWLAELTRAVFQAGFNWKVIDDKWPAFEDAFDGFDPDRWAAMSDDDLDRLLKNDGIVRHAKKILAVRDNAAFVASLREAHGSTGAFFGNSKPTAYVELLETMKKKGARLGGSTAQYFLRRMGVDSVIFTDHVGKALIREGVVDKPPTSKRDLAACQAAFNGWLDGGASSLTEISRVLAFTVDD
ncbi:MAG: DNA-3-methyladenine glycosylase I [Parvularculaceae bacterium]